MSAQKFQYNDRVAVALVPALLVFAAAAEAAVLGMLLVRLPALQHSLLDHDVWSPCHQTVLFHARAEVPEYFTPWSAQRRDDLVMRA